MGHNSTEPKSDLDTKDTPWLALCEELSGVCCE